MVVEKKNDDFSVFHQLDLGNILILAADMFVIIQKSTARIILNRLYRCKLNQKGLF